MFDSGVSASELIDNIKSEVDVSLPISNLSYVMWLNSVEQMLYSELILEQKESVLEDTSSINGNIVPINLFAPDEKEEQIRFDDIFSITVNDDIELTKSNLASAKSLRNIFYKKNNDIGISFTGDKEIECISILYYVRPRLKTVGIDDKVGPGNVMLPYEFLDLVKARLRGEAYKIMNVDDLAAKWINDYNSLMEIFKIWITSKRAEFGL